MNIVIKTPRKISEAMPLSTVIAMNIEKVLEKGNTAYLDLGPSFFYSSEVYSVIFAHHDNVIVVAPNPRFLQTIKLLAAESYVKIVNSLDGIDIGGYL